MSLAHDLSARGFAEHSSSPLENILSSKRGVYLGIDPTADSLHVGHLVPILLMKRLGTAGHRLVFLVGGGTGMIGDPREVGERSLLDTRTLEKNKRAIRSQLSKIVGKRIELVDNASWLLKVNLVEFLRYIGKHFTVNELIKRDIIKRRIEDPNASISYTEFAYSLLQGYDYLVLNKKYGVDLQIGASDQWTNILSGVELIRRKEGKEAFAITCPLVTEANGKKFGKSEGNAVWLDAAKTSPYQFYQFWLNQPDEMVEKYLKFFTFMSTFEIETMMVLHGRNPGKREAQKMLARLVTEIVHGTETALAVEAASEAVYGSTPLAELPAATLATVRKEVPSAIVSVGMSVVDALIASELVKSKSDAKRLIEAGSISVAGEPVGTVDAVLTEGQFAGGVAILRRGKQTALLSIEK
ncbi:MAG: tyrosine--tRNA ligase [Patescibacteria group bacterium]